jgi:hypothetical protein
MYDRSCIKRVIMKNNRWKDHHMCMTSRWHSQCWLWQEVRQRFGNIVQIWKWSPHQGLSNALWINFHVFVIVVHERTYDARGASSFFAPCGQPCECHCSTKYSSKYNKFYLKMFARSRAFTLYMIQPDWTLKSPRGQFGFLCGPVLSVF